MKKAYLPAIGLLLLLSAAWFFSTRAGSPEPSASAPQEAAPAVAPASSAAASAPARGNPSKSPSASSLDAATQAAVQECLGETAASWEDLSAAIEKHAAAGARELQWRVLKTEENGRELRVRLGREARESGENALVVQVFEVDEEGLPDLVAPKPGQRERPVAWLNEFLRDKPVREDARLEEITFPDGRTLQLESEGSELVEAQFQGPGKGLACSRKNSDPRCRCI